MHHDVSRMWRAWKAFAHRLATFQARVILTLLYFTALLPFSMLARISKSPFSDHGWCAREQTSRADRESAWKQS
jgi:hypothetical protein